MKFGFGSSKIGLQYSDTIPVRDQSRQGLYDLLLTTVRQIYHLAKSDLEFKGISLGSPGIIDSVRGTVLANCPNLPDWVGANPKELLREKFALPVFLENDANLAAFSEMFIQGRENKSVLLVTVGTGIGSGFVNRGEIFRGNSFSAMELGHTVVQPEGKPCLCGKKGCLETYSSAKAISEEAGKLLPDSVAPGLAEILSRYQSNREIRKVITAAYSKLGLAIANAIVILNPDVVAIGGGLTEVPSFDINPLSDQIKFFLNNHYADVTEIGVAHWQNNAAVWGGIILAEQNLKNIPISSP